MFLKFITSPNLREIDLKVNTSQKFRIVPRKVPGAGKSAYQMITVKSDEKQVSTIGVCLGDPKTNFEVTIELKLFQGGKPLEKSTIMGIFSKKGEYKIGATFFLRNFREMRGFQNRRT